MFFLLADYQIRLQTGNRKSLADALRGVGRAGGTIEQSWPIERVLAAADEATDTAVFAELYANMGRSAGEVDLEMLWKELGVVRDILLSKLTRCPLHICHVSTAGSVET